MRVGTRPPEGNPIMQEEGKIIGLCRVLFLASSENVSFSPVRGWNPVSDLFDLFTSSHALL
jgi:hypothetical protein